MTFLSPSTHRGSSDQFADVLSPPYLHKTCRLPNTDGVKTLELDSERTVFVAPTVRIFSYEDVSRRYALTAKIAVRYITANEVSQAQITIGSKSFCVPVKNIVEGIREIAPNLKHGDRCYWLIDLKEVPSTVSIPWSRINDYISGTIRELPTASLSKEGYESYYTVCPDLPKNSFSGKDLFNLVEGLRQDDASFFCYDHKAKPQIHIVNTPLSSQVN